MVQERRTAFVFTGGGSLGAVQVGMLKALAAHGVRADLVIGASVGAINAAYFASDPTIEGTKRLDQIWRNLRRRDVFPVSPFSALLGLLARRDHMVSSSALRHLLETHLPYARLEQAKIPCHVVATELFQGREICFSTGPVIQAVVASAAIPTVYPPVRIGELYLVDGSIANNAPNSTAVALGATCTIVLPTGFACAIEHVPTSTIGMALQTIVLYSARQLVRDIERFTNVVNLAVVPPLCPLSIAPHNFSRAGELIDRAEEATTRWLDKDGLERHGVPGALLPHED